MSLLEEQQEERDVLSSIFPDELTDLSDSSFSILIKLDLPPSLLPSGAEDGDEPPSVLLTIDLPPSYPSTAPTLSLSFPHPTSSSSRPPQLSTTDFPTLLSDLQPTIQESLGTAMIFTLHSALKESIESLIQARVDAVAAGEEDEKRKREEEEDRKFAGERVSREGFLRWREGFLREKAEGEERVRREVEEGLGKKGRVAAAAAGEEGGKLTGRMLWERGMVGKIGEEGEEGEGEGEGEERG